MSVGVNPPKTPVTKGSSGIATATLPNVCKMPGPPAPFVPTPLPNIGKSGDSPKGYTQNVKIEGKEVAIKGASFGSMGDAASKGTGGGMVSANTHGPCKFIGPGSMDVKFEGKNVHLLSDPVTNNGGGSGSPANAATMQGILQLMSAVMFPEEVKDTQCSTGGPHNYVANPAQGKKRMSQKIDEASKSRRKGFQFEAKAAAHNKKSGDLTNSSQLSGDPHEEKVFWKCTVCGHEREGDQLHDGPTPESPPIAVEVKSKARLELSDARQLGRNLQTAARGNSSGVIYKVPAGGGGNFIMSQIEKIGEMAGQIVKVIRI